MPRLFDRYLGGCPSLDGPSITEMTERARDVKHETFLRAVGSEACQCLEGTLSYSRLGMRLADDYHVSYHSSRYRGQRCYYLLWSGQEHVLVQGDE